MEIMFLIRWVIEASVQPIINSYKLQCIISNNRWEAMRKT